MGVARVMLRPVVTCGRCFRRTIVEGDDARAGARAARQTGRVKEEQLDRLDHVREMLRRSRRRISKSQFVRLALDNLLNEFEKDPDQVTRLLLQQAETPPR